MPANSAIVGVLMCAVWLTYFYGANLTEGWFGPFCFDSSELPIITLYALYIPMFLNVMRREKDTATRLVSIPSSLSSRRYSACTCASVHIRIASVSASMIAQRARFFHLSFWRKSRYTGYQNEKGGFSYVFTDVS